MIFLGSFSAPYNNSRLIDIEDAVSKNTRSNANGSIEIDLLSYYFKSSNDIIKKSYLKNRGIHH